MLRPILRQAALRRGHRRHRVGSALDKCAQVVGQQRLGLTHGFAPRLGVADAAPHTRDRCMLAIKRIAGVTVAHDHRGESLTIAHFQ